MVSCLGNYLDAMKFRKVNCYLLDIFMIKEYYNLIGQGQIFVNNLAFCILNYVEKTIVF